MNSNDDGEGSTEIQPSFPGENDFVDDEISIGNNTTVHIDEQEEHEEFLLTHGEGRAQRQQIQRDFLSDEDKEARFRALQAARLKKKKTIPASEDDGEEDFESENKRLKDELFRLRAMIKPTGNNSTLNNATNFVNRNKSSTPKGVKGGTSSSFQTTTPVLPAINNGNGPSIVANAYAEALLTNGSAHLRKCNVKMTANRSLFLVKDDMIKLVGELNAYIACGDIPLSFSTYYGNKAQDLVRTMMEGKKLIDFDLLKADPSYWYRTDTPESLKRFVENLKKAAELEEFQEKIN